MMTNKSQEETYNGRIFVCMTEGLAVYVCAWQKENKPCLLDDAQVHTHSKTE